MKKITKLTALLLSLAMVLGLAACGKTGGSSQSGEEKIKLTIGVPNDANVVSYEDNAFTHWLEEKSGYEIEVIPFSSDYPTQLSTMTAGGEELPDILFGFSRLDKQMQTYYGSEGFFLNLRPYFEDEELTADYRARMEELYDEDFYDFSLRSITVADGNIYGYPEVTISETDSPWFQVYINATWLDNLGLEMPTNYDEFVNVLRAFKTQDPNGNGQPDEIPALGKTNNRHWDLPAWVINNWEFTNDGTFFNLEDGQLTLPYDTDAYREGLKALNNLVEEGLLTTLTWTVTDNNEYKSILSPVDNVAKVGVFACHLSSAFNTDSPLLHEYQPLVPFNYAPIKDEMPGTGVFITTDTEYPDECFRLLQLISTEAGSMACRYGEEGVDWEWTTDYATGKPAINELRSFATQNQSTWNIYRAMLIKYSPSLKYHTAITNPPEEMTWLEHRTQRTNDYAEGYLAAADANNPDVICNFTLVYNDEESERLGNLQTDIMEYVKEMRAKFAVGELDPNSDADWNNYVETLHDMGTGIWLDCSQTAYERFLAS